MTPSNITAGARPADDIVEAMSDRLFHAAVRDEVDLGDERSVDRCLAKGSFKAGDILGLGDVAVERARSKAQRRAAIADIAGKGAEVVSFALVIGVWCVVYCLVCPPAHAADAAPFADVMMFDIMTAAPIVIAALLLLAWCWRDRTMHLAEPEAETLSVFDAPSTAPTLEQTLRNADGA